ncbi:MAG: sugar phosphate isomerase/epimerase family protein [Planctomycetota bacterium]
MIKTIRPAIFTDFAPALPPKRVIPMIRDAGFAVVSLRPKARLPDGVAAAETAAMGRLIRDNGLAVDSVHAPYPEGDRLFSRDEAERLESVRQCRFAIETAADLGGRVTVIHLLQPYGIPPGPTRDRMMAQGRRSVEALAADAAGRGISLALENGQDADYDRVLADFLTEFDGPPVGLCYDSGHENVRGACFETLERFGSRLLTVHIHDTRGTDEHRLPYEGNIDWDRFRVVFHGLRYSGNFLLESHVANSAFRDPAVFLAEARARAERLLAKP